MSLWRRLKEAVAQDAKKFVYTRVDPKRTDRAPGEPIVAHKSYLRVHLSDMFLTKSRGWFTDWHPCVSSSVRIALEGTGETTLTHVARPSKDVMVQGTFLNYPVTPLLPFSGNIVEIEAGLLALKGDALIDTALGVLEGFSSLVAPPIGQAIGVAQKVATGLETLVGAVDGKLHLGLHDAFGSAGAANQLQPGYLAVVLATPDVVNPDHLGVIQSRLSIHKDGAWSPLLGFDYMLFYIEGRTERDDWRFPSIQEPFDKAIEEAIAGDSARADAYKKATLVAALTCKELTPLDRRRVAAAIKEEFAAMVEAGQGAVGAGEATIAAIVTRHDRANVPTEEEILS